MREYKQHRGKREEMVRLAMRGAATLFLLFLAIILVRAAWGMYTKMAIASQGQEDAEVGLAHLEAQQQGVNTTLQDLSSQRGKEEQIRERYALARPGEGEIDIIHEASTSDAQGSAKESWWQRILRAFVIW